MNKQNYHIRLMVLWLVMLVSPLIVLVMVVVLHNLQLLQPVYPAIGQPVFIAGLVSVVLPVIMLRSYRKLNRTLHSAVLKGEEEVEKIVGQLSAYLVIGSAVAELPAIFGMVFFVLTGELQRTIILVLLGVVAGWHYKPDLPRNL